MPIHGPGTPLSISEINSVFGETSLSNLVGDAWYVGNIDLSNDLISYNTPGKFVYTCPSIAGTLRFEIGGAGGGGGGADRGAGHDGYPGNKIAGSYSFTAGDIITIYVGFGGGAGQGMIGNALGGAGGGFNNNLLVNPFAGGNGGNSGPTPYSGAGGGGGGASAILVNGVVIAVAAGGGGGGGGGRYSGGTASISGYSSTSTGEAGARHLSNGGGAGGGGGGYLGGKGGTVANGDLGGQSGNTGSNLFPTGWVSVPLDNNGNGATSTSNNQTSGSNGYVNFKINASNLQKGNFPTTNLRFSDFLNKELINPATTGTQVYNTYGAYTFTIPVYENNFTIEAWGGGGGGGGVSSGVSGGSTTVNILGVNIITAGGGTGGGMGELRVYGVGGLGGVAVGGNNIGSQNGQRGRSIGVNGDNSGGNCPNGGAGGSNASTLNANVVYSGGDGNAPGGGGGGYYFRDLGNSPPYFGGGGGGGGAYITYGPADKFLFAAGVELALNVGKGGDGGLLDTDQVGGAGADGKIILTWT
jgi:hypothetical protein